jgi:hypothetical protein
VTGVNRVSKAAALLVTRQTGDGLLMLGDRRLPFAVELDQSCIKPQLRRAEAKQFLDELKGLLLRETVKEPDEGDLVGKAKPVMRASALAQLREIFLGQGGSPFELVAGKHYLCDTANAEIQKDASLAYKITRISLVPCIRSELVQDIERRCAGFD